MVSEISRMGHKFIEAAMAGDLQKVSQMVARGADVNFANWLGVTALMVASQWNQLEIVRFLLCNGADVEARENSSGFNALMFACLSGNAEIVRLVLKCGSSVDSSDIHGRTALMVAAFCGSTKVVEMLLKHGADINAVDRFGATAFTQACLSGRDDIVNFLLAKGAHKRPDTANPMT